MVVKKVCLGHEDGGMVLLGGLGASVCESLFIQCDYKIVLHTLDEFMREFQKFIVGTQVS